MAKTTEKYEVLYVLNPNLSEEETQGVVEKFKTLIEQNGTIDEMDEWGKRGGAGPCAGHHRRRDPVFGHAAG